MQSAADGCFWKGLSIGRSIHAGVCLSVCVFVCAHCVCVFCAYVRVYVLVYLYVLLARYCQTGVFEKGPLSIEAFIQGLRACVRAYCVRVCGIVFVPCVVV